MQDTITAEHPELTRSMQIKSVHPYRDGSIKVTLEDAEGRPQILWFDGPLSQALSGRLYLKSDTASSLRPVAQDSPAERQILNLLRVCLATQKDVNNRELLVQRIARVEELRRLTIFGVITRQ